MILSHKIQIYPNGKQQENLDKLFGTARFVFNWGLARWKEQYELGQVPNKFSLKKEWTKLRGHLFPWSKEVSKCAYEDGFDRLDSSFKNFFKKTSKYPKFKKKKSKQSCEIGNDKFRIEENKVYLPKIGLVKLSEPLRFDGKILRGTLSKKAGRYYISISVEMEEYAKEKQETNQAVGIDVGVKDFLILSDGTKFENKKFLTKVEQRIKRLNQSISRKKKGSSNWKKAVFKLQVEYQRLMNRRMDYLHKTSTFICENYWLICIEDLNIAGMVKNRCLSKAISQLGIGEFYRQLEYKSKIYGNTLMKVGRFFPSSKKCSCCGYINRELTLSDRSWECPECHSKLDRDLNASTNILVEGIRLLNSTVP